MTTVEAKAAVAKYGSQAAAARALGIGRMMLHDAFHGRRMVNKAVGATAAKPDKTAAPAKRVISESDLLLATDIETAATSALVKELATLGNKQYMRDIDMKRACGCASDSATWKAVSQKEQFCKNVMEIGSWTNPSTYWGRCASIAGMIERHKARQPTWAKQAENKGGSK